MLVRIYLNMNRNCCCGMTQHEVEQLKAENSQLKEYTQHQNNKIGELTQKLHTSRLKTNELWLKNQNLEQKVIELEKKHVSEKKHLFRRIDELRRKICNKNCVACTILWICETVLGVDICIRQLEKIITAYAGEKIEKADLKCDQLMEILKKGELVSIEVEFKYPPEEKAKLRVIDKAWNTLMATDDSVHVIILGRVILVGNGGHVEICHLDTRTSDRTEVIIHNPQNENWGHANQDNFREHAFNDDGLILYLVHLEKLKQIISEHEDILHRTGRSDASLALSEGAVSAVPE